MYKIELWLRSEWDDKIQDKSAQILKKEAYNNEIVLQFIQVWCILCTIVQSSFLKYPMDILRFVNNLTNLLQKIHHGSVHGLLFLNFGNNSNRFPATPLLNCA